MNIRKVPRGGYIIESAFGDGCGGIVRIIQYISKNCEINNPTWGFRDIRHNRIFSNHKYIYVTKRKHPNNDECEICKKVTILSYHHWDDSKPELGMWLCISCHVAVEQFEKIPNLKSIYEKMKVKITREISNEK